MTLPPKLLSVSRLWILILLSQKDGKTTLGGLDELLLLKEHRKCLGYIFQNRLGVPVWRIVKASEQMNKSTKHKRCKMAARET